MAHSKDMAIAPTLIPLVGGKRIVHSHRMVANAPFWSNFRVTI
ncbi:hypothetical protein [Oculatella sp. FACHB-28]|nr:hypothetical protein [Oculatella sp. FACHB-28]